MRPRAGFAEFDFRGTVHPHSKQKELNESKPVPIVFAIVRKIINIFESTLVCLLNTLWTVRATATVSGSEFQWWPTVSMTVHSRLHIFVFSLNTPKL